MGIKKAIFLYENGFNNVIRIGFEPMTYCLEGSCSIQLSYRTKSIKPQKGLYQFVSGWQDSNLRPPAPKAGAITGLRYTPNGVFSKF